MFYYLTSNGNNCPSSGVVLTEVECKDAANQLALVTNGMSYKKRDSGDIFPAGCYYFRQSLYSKSTVYFNKILDPSATSPYSRYGAICSESTGMVI